MFSYKKGKVKKTNKKIANNRGDKVFKDLDGNIIKKTDIPKKKKISFKEHVKKFKKLYSLIVSILLLIVIGIIGYILINNFLINRKYKPFQKKMDSYGFSLMYDNQSAKSSEKVTKKEAVKVIISALYNTTQVETIGFADQGLYEDDGWVTTAIAFNMIDKDDITKENYDDNIKYREALMIALNARKDVLNIPVSSSKEASFKNLQAYSDELVKYINDAVENGLIEDSNKKIKLDNELLKGQLNELVINIVEKYNTIVPEGETLVIKEESKPDNAEIYPYIIYSVDKEAYEYEGFSEDSEDYKTPIETYKYDKDYYPQMEYRTEQYYNTILNVDYNTITVEEFKEKASEFSIYYEEDIFSNYIEYVKKNKIKVEGKAEVQLPVFYLDGIKFRARVKLEFEIKNSDTDKNILFADLTRNNEVTYKNKKYVVYIDAPMGTTLLSKALRLDIESIIDMLVSDKEAINKNEF